LEAGAAAGGQEAGSERDGTGVATQSRRAGKRKQQASKFKVKVRDKEITIYKKDPCEKALKGDLYKQGIESMEKKKVTEVRARKKARRKREHEFLRKRLFQRLSGENEEARTTTTGTTTTTADQDSSNIESGSDLSFQSRYHNIAEFLY
jgi:hypothetical protein